MSCPAVITDHRGSDPKAYPPGHRDLLHSMRPVLWDHRCFEAAAAADGSLSAGRPWPAPGDTVIEAWHQPWSSRAARWNTSPPRQGARVSAWIRAATTTTTADIRLPDDGPVDFGQALTAWEAACDGPASSVSQQCAGAGPANPYEGRTSDTTGRRSSSTLAKVRSCSVHRPRPVRRSRWYRHDHSPVSRSAGWRPTSGSRSRRSRALSPRARWARGRSGSRSRRRSCRWSWSRASRR